jgi:hypothetical protein
MAHGANMQADGRHWSHPETVHCISSVELAPWSETGPVVGYYLLQGGRLTQGDGGQRLQRERDARHPHAVHHQLQQLLLLQPQQGLVF